MLHDIGLSYETSALLQLALVITAVIGAVLAIRVQRYAAATFMFMLAVRALLGVASNLGRANTVDPSRVTWATTALTLNVNTFVFETTLVGVLLESYAIAKHIRALEELVTVQATVHEAIKQDVDLDRTLIEEAVRNRPYTPTPVKQER